MVPGEACVYKHFCRFSVLRASRVHSAAVRETSLRGSVRAVLCEEANACAPRKEARILAHFARFFLSDSEGNSDLEKK